MAGISIFTFRTIELPITRALSSGLSVGASLSGENLIDVLIRTEERCFDPRLSRLTVNNLPTELLPCDWLIRNLCYQAIEQVSLIKWPVSVYTVYISLLS